MNPTKSFISKYYYKLPLYNRCKLPFSDRTWSLDYKEEWDLSKNEIGFYIDEGSSGIDFLWKAIIFNLFAKMVYNYHINNYKYCVDFIAWRFDTDRQNIPIFKGKFKNFVDEKLLIVSKKKNINISDYSIRQMNSYCAFLFSIFELMNKGCCEFNVEEIVSEIIEDKGFRDEFSDDPKSMSYIFRKTLLNYN